jgi:glycosyltransferase involved in cell wall biosynthesis
MAPVFSIVTPSFRASDWLKLCIASVADQRDVTFEHIVQDSCSDDGTLDWLSSDPRVQAFIEKDAGMYDAVNRGLRRAQGEICAYLNCDEQYLPDALSRVQGFFRGHSDIDVVFGDVILINARGRPISYRRTVLPSLSHLKVASLNIATCATFFRRRLLDRDFYFDPQWKSVGDAVWVENLLKAKVHMAVLREPLAVFTQTGKNLGANAVSSSEAVKRRDSSPSPKLQTAWVVFWHRVRKAFAGAYRPRRVEIQIFTPDSPAKRKRIAAWVGFCWKTG